MLNMWNMKTQDKSQKVSISLPLNVIRTSFIHTSMSFSYRTIHFVVKINTMDACQFVQENEKTIILNENS